MVRTTKAQLEKAEHDSKVMAMLAAASHKPNNVVLPQKKKIGRLVSDVEKENIDTIWCNHFPTGMVTQLVGMAGTGKTTAMCDLIAHVTTGTPFHDGSETEKGSCVIALLEDKTENSARKKLEDALADTSKVLDISEIDIEEGTLHGSTKKARLCLPNHLQQLEDAISYMGDTRLVVLDPLSALVPLSENKMVSRAIMASLSDMAHRHNCAIVLINHPKKGKFNAENWLTAIGGSSVWFDACRIVKAIIPDDNNKQVRNIYTIKNNTPLTCPMLQYVATKEGDRFYIQYISDDSMVSTSLVPVQSDSENINAILHYMLAKAAPVSCTLILNEVTINGRPIPRSTIQSILCRFLQEGITEKVSYGFYELKQEYRDLLEQQALANMQVPQIATSKP